MATRRLESELKKVSEKFDVECVEDNIMRWHIALPGPDNSSYFGGTFLIEFIFSNDYPFCAPEVRFQTKIYHPNIKNEEICLGDIKNTWNPTNTALNILEYISNMLKFPNPDDPLVPEIGNLLKRDPNAFETMAEEWTHRYAM